MRRSTLVLLGFAALVIAEIWLLGFVGARLGVGWLLVILLAEAVLGGWLIRHEGAKAWHSLAEARDHPDALGARLTDAALVVVGGILVMAPGFVTDAVGLLCLLPFTRGWARRGVAAVMAVVTRPYRDQVDLMRARLEPETVVEGETVEGTGGPAGTGGAERPPDDPMVIRGEIEP